MVEVDCFLDVYVALWLVRNVTYVKLNLKGSAFISPLWFNDGNL